MSNTIDAALNHFPVFGTDVSITAPSLGLVLVVTGVDLTTSAEKAIFRNGVGDTKARVWYDIGQVNTLKLDATVIGGSEALAAANNDPSAKLPIGTSVTVTSSKYPDVAGAWNVDDVTSTGSNTGFCTWSITLVPRVT